MPQPPGEPFLEGVRFLRAALQTLPSHPLPKRILIRPAGPAPCAEDIARYLARSYAEAGKSVVYVPLSGQVGSQTADPLGFDRVQVMPPDGTVNLAARGGPRAFLAAAGSRAEFVVVAAGGSGAGQDVAAFAIEADAAVLAVDPAVSSIRAVAGEAGALRRNGARIAGIALCERRR